VLGGSANQQGVPMNPPILRTGLLSALLALGLAAPAQATPMVVNIQATVIVDGTTLVGVGTVLSLDLFIDDTVADLNGLPSDFFATNVGTVSSFLIVPVGGTVDDVTATPTNWDANATLDLNPVLPILLPASLSLVGVGATPDQVMPDFASLTSGLITVDVSVVAPGAMVIATVDSISIAPVPEPSLVALLGVVGLAWCGRRPAGGAKG